MIQLSNILKEVYFNGFTVSENNTEFRKPENFDKYAEGNGWTAWRGGNDWENGATAASVVFEGDDKSRMWFTIKYPEKLSEFVGSFVSENNPAYKRIYRAGKRITNKWIREAQRIHKTPRNYTSDGRPIRRDWKECFQLALESENLKPFIKKSGVDYTKWHAMQRKPAEIDKTREDQETSDSEVEFHNKHDAEPSSRSGLAHTHGRLPDDY